jgi:hypothetical protein
LSHNVGVGKSIMPISTTSPSSRNVTVGEVKDTKVDRELLNLKCLVEAKSKMPKLIVISSIQNVCDKFYDTEVT